MKDTIANSFKSKEMSQKKALDKKEDSFYKNNNKNKDEMTPTTKKVIYESIKKKLTVNNNYSNDMFTNYNKMKLFKNNKEKNKSLLNKTFNTSYTNNILKNNLNLNNSTLEKKSDKKVSQFAAKINKYYNKYTLNNIKNYSKKNNRINFEILNNNRKRSSIPDNGKILNFNYHKYITTPNKNNILYKNKRDYSKPNIYNQLNYNKNNFNYALTERNRAESMHKRISFSKKNNFSTTNILISLTEIKQKKRKIINIFKNNKNISTKEQAYYILATSPILRLSEQLIFSRASDNLRKVLSIDTILTNHKIFLKVKAKELMNEIDLCGKRIKTPFTASKIADITLNFVTSLDEQEFKNFDILETNTEIVEMYYRYIKLLYILFNINYDNSLENKKIKSYLFEKVKEKGFYHLRDYLYYIYISKKEEFHIVTKIDIINNELIKTTPNLLDFHESSKICRFTAFTNYLIKEIVNFANNIKDTCELKYKAQNLLDIVMGKIDKFQNKNGKSIIKPIKK